MSGGALGYFTAWILAKSPLQAGHFFQGGDIGSKILGNWLYSGL
jgi:hypothetical protein